MLLLIDMDTFKFTFEVLFELESRCKNNPICFRFYA